MPEYAPMLHVSYYAQNYAGIFRQGLLEVGFLPRNLMDVCTHLQWPRSQAVRRGSSCGLGMRLHWLVHYSYVCSLIPGLSPLHNDSEH